MPVEAAFCNSFGDKIHFDSDGLVDFYITLTNSLTLMFQNLDSVAILQK